MNVHLFQRSGVATKRGGWSNPGSAMDVAMSSGLGFPAFLAPLRLGVPSESSCRLRMFPRVVTRWSALGLWVSFFLLAAGLLAQPAAAEEGHSRFRAVDIYVDSKASPLAAYQIEFLATNCPVRIVGIEGGGHAAFRQPPFYDPKAMQQERVIIAAFSTEPAAKLPAGKTRVATIHIQIFGDGEPQYILKLQTAAGPDGNRIFATASAADSKPGAAIQKTAVEPGKQSDLNPSERKSQ
jgi:hypothetical protein